MEELLERCCGLDVHRDTITACVMIGNGPKKRKEIRTFSTFTRHIEELAHSAFGYGFVETRSIWSLSLGRNSGRKGERGHSELATEKRKPLSTSR